MLTILNCQKDDSNKGQVSTDDDIVMVQRDQIMDFYQRIKLLENNFQMLQSATQIKLEEEKTNYENAINKFKKQFRGEIKEVNVNLSEMATNKLKQERQTEKVFEQLEEGQVKNVDSIEKMYEKKCKILQ